MKPEIIKILLELWFEVSIDWYIDSEDRIQTFPVLCMYLSERWLWTMDKLFKRMIYFKLNWF